MGRAPRDCPQDDFGDLPGEERRNRVTNLSVLIGHPAFKKIIVRECLQPGRFPHTQAAALFRIIVDVVVPILSNMGGDGRCGPRTNLDPESVHKRVTRSPGYVYVIGSKKVGHLGQSRGLAIKSRVFGPEEVPHKILPHMAPAVVVHY